MAEEYKTEGTNAHVGQAEEVEDFGGDCAGDMLIALFDKAADNLTTGELKSLSGFGTLIEMEVRNLSENLMTIGCLVASDKNSGSFQNPDETSALLFSLSHQLSTLMGMVHVSAFARDRLDNPRGYVELEALRQTAETEETPKLTPGFSRRH